MYLHVHVRRLTCQPKGFSVELQKEPTALIGTSNGAGSFSSFLHLPAHFSLSTDTMDDVSAHPHNAFKEEAGPLPSCIGDVIGSQNLSSCEPS